MHQKPKIDRTLRTPEDLAAAGLLAPDAIAAAARVGARFEIAVPPALAALIDPGRADDPIARQFVPDPRELVDHPADRADPIGDQILSPVKGITHRYPDRVLLKPVLFCPVYCRFCFRREVVGRDGGMLRPDELDAAIAYIAADPGIWEVILTGGDPLVLSDRRLRDIVMRLARIDHLGAVRIHTRMPIATPERVTDGLVAALATSQAMHVVIHCNHPRELTEAAVAACRRLIDAGIPVQAQTVLLRGVNDDAATLETLFRSLVRHRIRPYYLHHADLAPGTAHFRTAIEDGRALMRALRGRLSGLALPTYMLDIPGGHGKVPIGPDHAGPPGPDGARRVADNDGDPHIYPGPADAPRLPRPPQS
ncbi:MAG: lysine-2,3-aminomutase-like protein [Alphaproteobacteria bacterium]|nr:lysine-2,3-aminomutase-like protein [Alphaproteobacteria bacterium]